ncbi:hypothetical protein D3OALGB2SA_405 [Olavius algarvensis associated proteobacterium Delta 3]|nr:hypothetical protein D3OALGB2SA_405 [Olavius algarvensis associated proteobacterium Delta 3]
MESIAAVSTRMRSTTAVELSATMIPMSIALPVPKNGKKTPKKMPPVTRICSNPAKMIFAPKALSRWNENSRPMENSSRATPISATLTMASVLNNRGPATAPAAR